MGGRVGKQRKLAPMMSATADLDRSQRNHHPLCTAYKDIGEKVDLTQKLLGVCAFDTDIASVKKFCRDVKLTPSVQAPLAPS